MTANVSMRCWTSGDLTTRINSVSSFFTMAGGTQAGVNMALQNEMFMSGNPASAMVGTSGNWCERADEVMAMARTLPALIKPAAGPVSTSAAIVVPAITEVNASVLLL